MRQRTLFFLDAFAWRALAASAEQNRGDLPSQMDERNETSNLFRNADYVVRGTEGGGGSTGNRAVRLS